jgi:uncharacterized protein (TIGR02302 family)
MDQLGPQHGQDRLLDAPARNRLDRKIALARGALFWERLWPALWLPGLVIGAFLTLALLDILPLLPFWAHAGLLGLFAAALLVAVWRGLSPVAMPDDLSGRRRLEIASGLSHRPLSGIDDSLALGAEDPVSRALWEVHRRRLVAGLARLKVGLPVAGWGRIDPWGARAAIGLLLVVGLAASWGEGGARVMRALVPEPGRGVAGPGLTLDVWINPPTYTGKAPLFLDPRLQQAEAPIEVPAGSTVLVQVNGLEAKPVLRVDDRPTEFESLGATSHRATTVLTSGSRIAVANGRAELGAWPILVVADQPPTITFRQPPSQSDRNALRIDYAARDDYGIDKVSVRIRRVDDSGVAVEGEDPIEIGLGLPGLGLKEAANSSYHDLTAHPWAGLNVAAVLTATDAIGQTGESEAQKIVLPEKTFRHPVARAIVAERKKLAQAPAANRVEVAKNLAEIASRPGAYADDMVVFMGLKSAMGRLRHDDSKDGLASTLQLLWDIALRVEDGDVSLAMRELRQAQQAVEDALNRDAEDQELARLMDELQRAIDKYIEAMTRQMMEQQQQGQQQEMQPLPPNAQLVDRQDLQRMLDKARELARSGNKDAAREMLSQLREMMENLRTAQPGQSQQNQQMQQTMKMLQNLQDLAKRQRQLLDQSHQREQGQQGQQGQRGQQGQGQQGQRGQQGQGQRGQPGQGQQGQRGQGQGQPGQGDPGAADTQDAVRRMLGDLMRQMGEGGDIPDQFGRAERAMRDAANALRGGGEASGSQAEALDQLQKGAQQMAEDMARQMEGQQPGQGMGEGPGDPSQGPPRAQADRQGRDPLGRPTRNSNGQSRGHVEIPEEADIQRSREIFDELRRRGSESDRPQIERDYIDRLLRRF